MENYRKSSYLIDVGLEGESGKHMFIHGYTGAIDVVSDRVSAFLKKHMSFTEGDIEFSKETFDVLTARGYVTRKTKEEEHDYVSRLAALLHRDSKRYGKSFMFLVSYDCNFRCPYCYEAGISGNGRSWSKKTFTKELVDNAYDAMVEIEPDREKHHKTITLYGGEPLLKENVEIVRYIVNKGTELGYNFHAVTNGHDLDYYEDILALDSFNFLQITLDGDREMHDSRRFHYETGKSFDKVFANIKLALDNNVKVGVRFNADANNYMEIPKLEKLFKEAGYSDNKNFSFNAALLQDENPEAKNENISYVRREEFNRMYKEAGLNISHQDYGLYEKLMSALKNNRCIRFHSIFCGVQSGSYIFDPLGDIHTCWDMVGIKKYAIGTYSSGLEWNENLKDWHGRNIGNTPQCSHCRYALLCGGGCLGKTLKKKNDDFKASYCDGYADTVRLMANKAYKEIKAANII